MAPKNKDTKEKNQNIQVAVRCRPLSSAERKSGSHKVVDVNSDGHEVCVKERCPATAPTKKFSFDKVFGPNTKQIEVYRTMVQPTIEEVLMGYNCTIFAYGQTGTGKTFTMEGESSNNPATSWEDDPLTGIIPRAMHHLFSRLDRQECEYSVRVSFLEIYNEELIDLLGADAVENPRLKIYEDATRKGSCVIQGLEEVVVRNKSEVYNILQTGTAKRQTAATLMNAHSSRSHSLFMVTIHIKENSVDGEELLKTGKLNLVDLAGSECVGRSGAVDKRAREAGNINQSLLTLGRVITSLVEHAPHVPYRESKLTRLLQDSLGGRTKTSIIATISPASSNLDETLSTLDYACRAKNITNRPEINQRLTKKALLKEYNEEIERLRRDLQATRDKNGIFLAQENYDGMQSTILQQKDTIKEMEDRIEHFKEEMFKLDDLFTNTKQELVFTQEELEHTSKSLESTKETLHGTQMNLQSTRQDRDEQKFLLTKHESTENVLHTKALKLLETSEEASSDVSGLHQKLARKKKVEENNEELLETFKNDFHRNIKSISQNVCDFQEKQLSSQCELCTDITEMVERREKEVKKTSESLDQLTELVIAQSEENKKSQELHVQNSLEHMSKLKVLVEECQNDNTCRQFDFQQETFLGAMISIKTILNGVTDDLKKLTAHLSAKIDSQKQEILTFSKKQLTSFEKLDQLITTNQSTQEAYLEKSTECATGMLASHSTLSQNLSAELITGITDLVKRMVDKQEDHLTDSVEQVKKQNLDAEGKLVTYTEDTTRIKEDMSNNVHEVTTKITESLSGMFDSAEEEVVKMTDDLKRLEKQEDQLQEHVVEFNLQTENILKDNTKRVVCLAEQHSEFVEASMNSYADYSRDWSAGHSNQVSNLKAVLSSEHTQLKSDLTSNASSLENMSEGLNNFTDQIINEIKKRDHDVEELVTSELGKDIPTGLTPQRRQFTYPRVLDKTESHHALLKNFRSTYILDEALNTPILEDSFTGMSEVSQATDVAVMADVQPHNADDPNTSADSAISSISMLSTASETSQNSSESKENLTSLKPRKATSKYHSKSMKENIKTITPKTTPNKVNSTRTPNNKQKTKLPLRTSNN